jgi:hypothetical protein
MDFALRCEKVGSLKGYRSAITAVKVINKRRRSDFKLLSVFLSACSSTGLAGTRVRNIPSTGIRFSVREFSNRHLLPVELAGCVSVSV